MRRTPTKSLDDIMGRMLREDGLETPLMQHRALDMVKSLLGQGTMEYVESVRISNQTVFVKVSSAPLRQNLLMLRTGILSRLGREFPNVVTDIRFV